MAERAAWIGASIWRLSCNHAVPMIFRTDFELAGGQAIGRIGTQQPDLSYQLLRTFFQALEMALPRGDLQVRHVAAHAGDCLACRCGRQARGPAVLQSTTSKAAKLTQLWTLFGSQAGLPTWRWGTQCPSTSLAI